MSEGPYISVIGAGEASDDEAAAAEEIGRRLAEAGAVLVCGGLGGVMDAAARGCVAAGGISVGSCPATTRTHGSPSLTVAGSPPVSARHATRSWPAPRTP